MIICPKDLSVIRLKDLFSRFGNVIDAYIPNEFGRKSGKKYGFIRFADITEGKQAIEHTNGKIVGDCKLQVSWAKF